MVITYHGGGMIKVVSGERTLCFNPSSKSRFAADVVLASCHDPRWNGVEAFRAEGKKVLVIDGPGEYETEQIFVRGEPTAGPNSLINTVYCVELDGLRLVHLGALTTLELGEAEAHLGAIDVLFVPVNRDLIEPARAAGLALKLDPRVLVPVEHGGLADSDLQKFLKEYGMENPRHEPKLLLRAKDLVPDKTEVVILAST